MIASGDDVVAVLTGHVLKDPEYILNYHSGKLAGIGSTYANRPVQVEASAAALRSAIESLSR